MDLQRCDICIGSGKMMGGGMIFKSCDKCLGVGKLAPHAEDCMMSKDSNSYKNAKEKIKALDDKMSDDEAEKLLDEELGKLDEKPKAKKAKRKKGKKQSRKS